MILKGITQPPFNTSLMGVIRGAADFYGMKLSTPKLYGLSGHAFIMNVHDELCPSSPYVWNHQPFYRLLQHVGLGVEHIGFLHSGSTPYERTSVEKAVKNALDSGCVCGCLNKDNQIIYGYDDSGLLLTQPWADMENTPSRLSYGSWIEFGDEMHVCMYTIRKTTALPLSDSIKACLEFAVDLWDNPESYSEDHYGMGPRGYENWIRAVETGHGGGHGAWWNAVVWSECKEQATEFFTEVGEDLSRWTDPIIEAYKGAGEYLAKTSDKEMDPKEKVRLLNEAWSCEMHGPGGRIGRLLVNLDGNCRGG